MEENNKINKEEESNEESNEDSEENSNEDENTNKNKKKNNINNINNKEEDKNNINNKEEDKNNINNKEEDKNNEDNNENNNINNKENNKNNINEQNQNIVNNNEIQNEEEKNEFEEEEEEEQLDPPRPELDEIHKQTIKLLSPSEESHHHPRTIFFMNDPEINSNKQNQGLNITEYEIKKKKFMVVYKAYKNLPQTLSGPMKYNQIIRSKLFANTNLIWKLLPREKMYLLLRKLNKFQKYNHFPVAWQLGRKDNLYTNYLKMQKKFPNEYNFMPENFILPKDKEIVDEKLKEYNVFDRENIYIVKPVASSRGRGVRILTDVTTLPNRGMLEKYIYNPHLINKKKYDIRLYLLVTGFNPLKIYLYENGLVRFCSENFDIDPDKMNNNYVHITNFSVNKAIAKIKSGQEDEIDFATKWSIFALKGYFLEKKLDFNPVWRRIKDIMIKLIISVFDLAIPPLKQFKLNSTNLFELYGVDILLDDKLKPWLLECNLNPSLSCDTEVDLKVKSKLITDVLNIIGLVPFTHDGNDKPLDYPNYYKTTIEEGITESLCEFERPSGGFERIFPTKETIDIYSKLIDNPGEINYTLWDEIKGVKKK